jgi:hypothetical protein
MGIFIGFIEVHQVQHVLKEIRIYIADDEFVFYK